HARSIKHRLAPFTLVGATTRPGMLSAPLRKRFGIFHHLDFYSDEELTRIVTRSAMILEARVDAAGAREISRRSRGTPRIVNRLLRRVRDYAQVKADGAITEAGARDAPQREGVEARGLAKLDPRVPWIGRLPGDIHIQRGNWHFYFPLATSIVLSLLLTLLFWLFGRR